jgi:hypothetical protein
MAFESSLALLGTQVVHAKPDAERVRRDGQTKRDGKGRQSPHEHDDAAHPVLNAQGEITGKLIDITA